MFSSSWNSVEPARWPTWSRTQRETLWKRSGLLTSAGRFSGLVPVWLNHCLIIGSESPLSTGYSKHIIVLFLLSNAHRTDEELFNSKAKKRHRNRKVLFIVFPVHQYFITDWCVDSMVPVFLQCFLPHLISTICTHIYTHSAAVWELTMSSFHPLLFLLSPLIWHLISCSLLPSFLPAVILSRFFLRASFFSFACFSFNTFYSPYIKQENIFRQSLLKITNSRLCTKRKHD